jgi:radical SAM superfamily enzyme YgiQ (UPF0313 family)
MKNKKILIYLADLVHDYLPGNYVTPLNIGLIATYTKENFNDLVEIKLFKSPQFLLDEIKKGPIPDIVGFSNYSWNQELNRNIMNLISNNAKDIVFVVGGPHIRTDPKGIADYLREFNNIDYYCMFEGEIPFGNLIDYFILKGNQIKKNFCDKEISGVAYLKNDKLVYNPIIERDRTITDIPSPYTTGILDEFIGTSKWIPLLESNRGCPFACTFCVWGIAALDKVRTFPMDRITSEIKYIAKRSPAHVWIFADANFGMLDRDIDIAKEIRKIADEYNVLHRTEIWWAKNSSKRTTEITKILGKLSDPLAAVQSLDPEVLKKVKRGNIGISTMTDLLEEWKKQKIKSTTDVLVGLPGDSVLSHLETLRKCFDMEFNSINVGNVRMLPGSEMESDMCRNNFNLKTKYRLISGSYGKYNDMPIFEYEESVRSSKDITESEMHSLRIIHFFVYAFWNVGIAMPLLQFIHKEKGINPLDLLFNLAKQDNDEVLNKFLEEFDFEAKKEWFESAKELKEYYNKNFDNLIENGFLKLNFKYIAKLILNKDFIERWIDKIVSLDRNETTEKLAKFCLDRIYFIGTEKLFKKIEYDDSIVEILRNVFPYHDFNSNTCFFNIDSKYKQDIEASLKKYNFEKDPLRALTLTLESYLTYFLFDFQFGKISRKETVGNLAGSFDYQAQLASDPEIKNLY